MTTKEMISQIAKKSGLKKVQTEELLNATTAVLQKELLAGKSVSLQNFGSLEMTVRNARAVIHPKTGEKTIIPEKMQLSFKPTEGLKDRLKKA